RPAIDRAVHEADGLEGFDDTVVVEIAEARVPAPAAPRKSEGFAAFDVRRDPLLHQIESARAQEDEMAFFERVLGGDVADVDVEQAIAIQVREVYAHALKGIFAEHFGAWRGEARLARQHLEAQDSG